MRRGLAAVVAAWLAALLGFAIWVTVDIGNEDREVLPEASLPTVSKEQVHEMATEVPAWTAPDVVRDVPESPTPTAEPTVEPEPTIVSPVVPWVAPTVAPTRVATVVPTVVATATRAPVASTSGTVYQIVARYFPGQADYAYAVFGCESGWTFNPAIIGALGEVGVAQVHPIHFARFGRPPADLEGQIAHAATVVRALSWSAWACA